MGVKALLLTTGSTSKLVEVSTLDELRTLVNGPLEFVRVRDGRLVVHESGHALNLPVNELASKMYPGTIVGDVVMFSHEAWAAFDRGFPMPERGPELTGQTSTITLTGLMVPGDEEMPVIMNMQGSPHLYMPMFTNEAALESFCEVTGMEYTQIKTINDQDEFLEDFPMECDNGARVKFIIDPQYDQASQRIVWTEVQIPEPEAN